MARGFNTARRTGTTIPRVMGSVVLAAQTFKKFAVVTLDPALTGKVIECASPPDLANKILGLALQGAFTGPGYNVSDTDQTLVTTGTDGSISVAVADREQEFSGRGVNGATDPYVPLQTDIGKQYGIKKVSDDWVVDITEVANVAVQITGIVPALGNSSGYLLFKFLESVMIQP